MAEPGNFPKGSIAMGNGDLMQVTDVKYDLTNGAKVVHTLRVDGAGTSKGNEETTVSFNAVTPETGMERDYMKMVKKGEIRQLRIKIPGDTITVNGVANAQSIELPIDGAVKYSITFVGKTED